jgi:hypothetical protein
VREEPVRLLEERDQPERLAHARVHEPLVVRDPAELDEERRIEVEAVDEDAGPRVVE